MHWLCSAGQATCHNLKSDALQKIEIHVRREDEAEYYNLDVRQRVHVQVDAAEMMPFNKDEIDSSPLG